VPPHPECPAAPLPSHAAASAGRNDRSAAADASVRQEYLRRRVPDPRTIPRLQSPLCPPPPIPPSASPTSRRRSSPWPAAGRCCSQPRAPGVTSASAGSTSGRSVFVDLSALAIRHLTGRFNLFHALALLSLGMVLGGVAQVRYRRRLRRWLWRHYQYMCWSYAALVAGAVNEATTRVPALRHLSASTRGGLPVLDSAAVIGAAAAVIFAHQPRLLATFDPSAERAPSPSASSASYPFGVLGRRALRSAGGAGGRAERRSIDGDRVR
jgi:hypothetical protein